MRYVRLTLIAALAGLLCWLWVTPANPWSEPGYVARVVRALSSDEQAALRSEIEILADAAGTAEPIRLNEPYVKGSLNVYVVSGEARAVHGVRAGDARYMVDSDTLLLDERVVWPMLSGASYASVSPHTPAERSGVTKLWLHLIVLHELGHCVLHRTDARLSLESKARPADLETEADIFAFDTLARAIAEGRLAYDAQNTLFASVRINALPPPDRGIATIASIIQSFSVNLLFSDVAFSPYHSDLAHRAFAERFKPYLSSLLGRATTREAQTFLLLAMSYIDRVASAGKHVVAEIVADWPIAEARFVDGALALRSVDGASAVRVSLAGLGNATGSGVAVRMDNAAHANPSGFEIAPLASSDHADPSEEAAPTDTPEARADAAGDSDLIEKFNRLYFAEESGLAPCSVVRSEGPSRQIPVVFACRGSYYTGYYDAERAELKDLQFHAAPEHVEGTTSTIVDLNSQDGRKTYFVQDTLTDQIHAERHQLAVWLANGPRPQLVARTDLVTDWIPTGSSLHLWLQISHPPVLSCRVHWTSTFTCVEFLDSVFSFTPATRDLDVLFYPAGAQMRTDDNARFVFYARGGYRAFVSTVRGPVPQHEADVGTTPGA